MLPVKKPSKILPFRVLNERAQVQQPSFLTPTSKRKTCAKSNELIGPMQQLLKGTDPFTGDILSIEIRNVVCVVNTFRHQLKQFQIVWRHRFFNHARSKPIFSRWFLTIQKIQESGANDIKIFKLKTI